MWLGGESKNARIILAVKLLSNHLLENREGEKIIILG